MAVSATHQALHSFQNNIEEIRSLASCKICLRPFYEPFMLSCGHTFCYGCLRNWICGGESRKKNKSCPECRAAIRDQPAPNYALRDLAHMFTDRAELLPMDETLEDHKQGKLEEAQLLADDRRGPGLFKNLFNRYTGFSFMPRSMWDPSDGVHRCPVCNWELEDSFCNHCGFDAVEDSMDDDISDDDDDDDEGNSSISDESDISIDIPAGSMGADGEDDGETLGPHATYEATDASETGTDTDPYPWGYRFPYHHRRTYGGFEDEEDYHDDSLDYSDGMGDFIDDEHYHDDDRYLEGGLPLSNLLNRPAGSLSAESHDFLNSSADDDDDDDDDDNDNDDDSSSTQSVSRVSDPSSDEGEDRSTTPVPSQSAPKRRGRLIISDDDDDEEDSSDDDDEHEAGDSDHFEDAVTGQESSPNLTAGNPSYDVRARNIHGTVGRNTRRDYQHSNNIRGNPDEVEHNFIEEDDGGDDDGDEDEDDDDGDPIPAQRARERSRQLAMHTARRGAFRGSRGQRAGTSGPINGRGYHPYSRPHEPSQPNNRYRGASSRSQGDSRTTTVY